MSTYFDDVAARLRERGVDEEHARELLDDLAAYTEESGTDPVTEFGPPDRFAVELTTTADDDSEADSDVFRWACDAFIAPDRLNEMGAQGWEVEKVDALGRFVSHRPPERPQTWEYRQEITTGSGDRERLTERLAPEGWEPCGHWSVLAYFKRPVASEVGPAAELDEVPKSKGRRFVMGKRGLATIVVCLTVAVVSLIWSLPRMFEGGGDAADTAWTVVGMFTGAAIVLVPMWLGVWLFTRFRRRS